MFESLLFEGNFSLFGKLLEVLRGARRRVKGSCFASSDAPLLESSGIFDSMALTRPSEKMGFWDLARRISFLDFYNGSLWINSPGCVDVGAKESQKIFFLSSVLNLHERLFGGEGGLAEENEGVLKDARSFRGARARVVDVFGRCEIEFFTRQGRGRVVCDSERDFTLDFEMVQDLRLERKVRKDGRTFNFYWGG